MATPQPKAGEYNQAGIAKCLGLCVSNFNVWARSGKSYLPKPDRTCGRFNFWDQDTIFSWIEAHSALAIKKDANEYYAAYRRDDHEFMSAGVVEEIESELWPVPQETKTDGYGRLLNNAFYKARGAT